MSVRLKNTANDRSKAHLHRAALRFEPEPVLAGRRIRLDETITIPDELYEKNKKEIDSWVKMGVVEVLGVAASYDRPIPHDKDGLRLDGPTLEEWVKAGYPAENYPPETYAEKPSAGLTKFRSEQAEAEVAAAMAKTIAKEEDEKFLEDVEKKIAEEAAKNASTETQTPLTMGGEVTITETLPPAEVLAEIAPPPVPNVPLGMTKDVAVLDEKQDLLPPKKTETTPPAETSASAPAETKKGKKKLF
jgi:hypothetical protein